MNLSATSTIATHLKNDLGVSLTEILEVKQPFLLVESGDLHKVCSFLYNTLYFDLLNCITAADNGADKGTLDLIYHFTSIPKEISLILKVVIPRDGGEIDSLSGIWNTANWHEREIFDLFGITFTGHPDLRRILLPADWVGHPLRKDYEEASTYHGLKIKYE